jgi:hypothetical protein
MATLFHALSGAVTGKVFLFDGTMKGWEVMEEVIRVGGWHIIPNDISAERG